MSKLQGKVAVVTGASKGLGAAIAKALAAEGAAVAVNYASSPDAATAVVDAITNAGGKAIAVQGDVSKESDAESLIAAAVKAFGRLDILVNNAGVYEMAPVEAITPEHFRRHFDLNVLGLLLVTKAASKHLGEGASVINLGSVVSTLTPPGSSAYTASKAAVDALSGVHAKEFGPRRIRVNTLRPGLTETEGTHKAGMAGTAFEERTAAMTPLGRIGQPDDIAKVAVFLASDDSGWVTGQSILVSGGQG